MLGAIDLDGIETQSSDRLLLQGYVQQLVGQPFLDFRFSYGDELSIHFGEPRAPTSKLKARMRGSYILGTRASHWYLRSATPSVLILGMPEDLGPTPRNLRSLAREDLEGGNLIAPEACVTLATAFPLGYPEATASAYALSIVLSDGASLLIAPAAIAAASVPEGEVADWELFTPHERLLRVGPGLVWSYLPSHRPAAAPPA
jgi:hypothetical protein